MDILQLKTTLRDIKTNNYELENKEMLQTYSDLMLENLGHEDPELRDELIYSTFSRWIMQKEYFSPEQLSKMFDQLISDDFIFFNIEVKDTTSVYKRSFTLLVLNLILNFHEENEFLSNEQVENFRKAAVDYLKKEHDFRGYDASCGWAHALAHWADLSYFITMGIEEPESKCVEVLNLIQEKYLSIQLPLSHDEDERLHTNIAYGYLDENMISLEAFSKWIEGFKAYENIEDKYHKFVVQTNIKQFIRSLYFRMKFIESPDEFMQPVIELEKHLNKYLFD